MFPHMTDAQVNAVCDAVHDAVHDTLTAKQVDIA